MYKSIRQAPSCRHLPLIAVGRHFSARHGPPSSASGEQLPATVSNALKFAFIDFPGKRCSLCGDNQLAVPKAHAQYVSHRARISILEKALAGSYGVMPMDFPKRTWSNLHTQQRSSAGSGAAPRIGANDSVLTFDRIPSLSAGTQADRRNRMFYLLEFLVDRGVIKHSLSLQGHAGVHRNKQFETFEMVGDNAVKYLLQDRVNAMFSSGGASTAASSATTTNQTMLINLLDSNEGLRTIFDYLSLEKLVGIHLPNSKLKSDVVESLFGELQVKLWASEISHDGCEVFSALKAPEHRYLIALVRHVLNELGHILLQWAVEETIARSKSFIEEHLPSLPITRRIHEAQAAQQLKSHLSAMYPALNVTPKPNSNLRPIASSSESASLMKSVLVRPSEVPRSPPIRHLATLYCVSTTKAYHDAVVQCIHSVQASASLKHAVEQQAQRRRSRAGAQLAVSRRDVAVRLLALKTSSAPLHSSTSIFRSPDRNTLVASLVKSLGNHSEHESLGVALNAAGSPPLVAPEGHLLDPLVHRTLASGGFVRDARSRRSLPQSQ